MKTAILRRFQVVSRSLPHVLALRLRRAVPQFQARTRGMRHPKLVYQQALALVKQMSPGAKPAEHDAMAFYLIARADMADFEASIGDAARQVDSMSEMGEMESLRLQKAMDRMAKVSSTLSNLLKKMSETSSGITQNLK